MEVHITRDSLHSPWGIRLVGGADYNYSPLVVAKISPLSCAFGSLRVGDTILAINGQSVTGMSHADAVHIVQSAGTTCTFVVRRAGGRCQSVEPVPSSRSASSMSMMASNNEKTALPTNSQLASLMQQSMLNGQQHRRRGLTSADMLARTLNAPTDVTSYLPRAPRRASSVMSNRDRDSPPVMDYGRQQAIGVWTPPNTCPSARLVHGQYNSPMALYTPNNIANMIEQQTGTKISWQRKPAVRFLDDIRDSHTYKYIKEMEGRTERND